MLKFIKGIFGLFLLQCLFSINVHADEYLDKTRVSVKQLLDKGCLAGTKTSQAYQGVDVEQLCGCSSEKAVSDMTDDDIKELLLNKNQDKYKNKFVSAMTTCMTTGPTDKSVFKKMVYQGCIKKKDPNTDSSMDMEAYCECASNSLASDVTPEDMQDFIKIGSDPNAVLNTHVSSKMLSVAAECVNKMVK